MIYPWFYITQKDKEYYKEHIQSRLPDVIIDAHTHMNSQNNIRHVSQKTIDSDWAIETGLHMDFEGYQHYYSQLFPQKRVEINAFPFPLPEVDIPGNNQYLGELADNKKIRAMMSVRPEWSEEICEEQWASHHFVGIKPYPYMATSQKGADISIFDFMPHHQFAWANKHKTNVMLHLPRHERLASQDNIAELLEIRDKYPDVTVILAHIGRSFEPEYFRKGMSALGQYKNDFYYDFAAVTNKEVHRLTLETIDYTKLLFGTDEPIFLWHGYQTWNEKGSAVNHARENFSWNMNPDDDENATFMLYVQLKNMLDVLSEDSKAKNNIFYHNANQLLK